MVTFVDSNLHSFFIDHIAIQKKVDWQLLRVCLFIWYSMKVFWPNQILFKINCKPVVINVRCLYVSRNMVIYMLTRISWIKHFIAFAEYIYQTSAESVILIIMLRAFESPYRDWIYCWILKLDTLPSWKHHIWYNPFYGKILKSLWTSCAINCWKYQKLSFYAKFLCWQKREVFHKQLFTWQYHTEDTT